MTGKGILKFKGKESKGPMHYVTFNNDIVSITLGTSKKVQSVKKKGKLLIANTLLSRYFADTKVELIEDKKLVKEVFEYMKSIKNTHYKKWDDDLVILKYIPQSIG